MKEFWESECENIERKQAQEIALFSEKRDLTFAKVRDRIYHVFNPRTNRFHNLELGIDWVIDL